MENLNDKQSTALQKVTFLKKIWNAKFMKYETKSKTTKTKSKTKKSKSKTKTVKK